MHALQPDVVIDEKFRIIDVLGTGGFGTVYKAEDIALKRVVAIKVLNLRESVDATAYARFRREAQVLATLDHANIVKIYCVGLTEDSSAYIVMQYLQGKDLRMLIDEQPKLDWRRSVQVVAAACDGLAAAHAQGVIHRDLKPENIMLLSGQQLDAVKILDFGLSRFGFEDAEQAQKLTQTGMVVGTVFYLSPEACLGQKAEARSDIYSLGCILYEALVGHRAIEAPEVVDVLYKHINDLPPSLDTVSLGIPNDLEAVVFKAIQKDPADRFQSMLEFREALDAVLGGKPQSFTVSGIKIGKQLQRAKQSVVHYAMLSAAVTIGIFAIAWLMLMTGENWQKTQEKADLLTQTLDFDSAGQQYRKAIALAHTPKEKFASQMGLCKLQYRTAATKNASAIEDSLLKDALKNATDDQQRSEALTLLGIASAAKGDHQRALEYLKSDPWGPLAADKDSFFQGDRYRVLRRDGMLAKANAYIDGPNPDPQAAIDTLTKWQQKFEYTRTYSAALGTLALARAYKKLGNEEKARQLLSTVLVHMNPNDHFSEFISAAADVIGEQETKRVLAMRRDGVTSSKPKTIKLINTNNPLSQRGFPVKDAYKWQPPVDVSE